MFCFGSVYGFDKVKGVNLGGWLVIEGWIEPSLFDGIPNGDMLVSSVDFLVGLANLGCWVINEICCLVLFLVGFLELGWDAGTIQVGDAAEVCECGQWGRDERYGGPGCAVHMGNLQGLALWYRAFLCF